MSQITNGMPASPRRVTAWKKSRHSNPHGDCVEFRELEGGKVAVRNSRCPDGPALIFARAEMAAFVQGAAEEEFVGRGQSNSPARMPVVNANHSSAVNVSAGAVGSLESRTARTPRPESATSRQFPEVPL